METVAIVRNPTSFVSTVQLPDSFTMVIFGATGDLAARKLLPALFSLWKQSYLPGEFAIVGVGRRAKTDQQYREDTRQAIATFGVEKPSDTQNQEFEAHLHYQCSDFSSPEGHRSLAQRLEVLEKEVGLPGNRLFYLATDPDYFAPIIEQLSAQKSLSREGDRPWSRVVIEKPFGHDLASALVLNQTISRFLRQEQIYRIDHYLGKETVQNLLAFRFGNAIFEPLFNRHYVEHVQVTAAETVGMEGRRGAFYDHAGALRDVVQNHLLQLTAMVAMEPPATLKACDLSDAKLKVLRSMSLPREDVARWAVRGQYSAGMVDGKPVPAYREEEAVARDSSTETYAALRVDIDTWRWAGVPFLLRTGKRLPRRVTEIAVQFKLPPLRLFRTLECAGDFCDLTEAQPSVLVFRIQPNEGISLSFSTKRPGMNLDLHPVRMDFDYKSSFHQPLPEAYERLILDALRGDASLFMRSDELEAAWKFVTPILKAWEQQPEFPNYAAGSWGPAEAERLTQDCQGGWRRL